MALADARPAAILAPAPDALVLAVAPHRRIALAPRGARKSLPLDARRPRARDPAGHVRDDADSLSRHALAGGSRSDAR